MGQLTAQLLPEMVGLLLTPAAIVACILLLTSSRGPRNVALFAVAFLIPYLVLSVLVLALGSSVALPTTSGRGRGWVSVVVGVLFLLGGALSLLRRPTSAAGAAAEPAWAQRLREPKAGGLMVTGLVLSVLNPNVAILISGLNTVLALAQGPGQTVLGVLLLLLSALLDFLVPVVVSVLLGARSRTLLEGTRTWLMAHNRALAVGVLLFFGAVFLIRGLTAVF